MRLIDADALRKCVMKWLPKDPCGIEEKEFPFETDICVSMLMEIDEQPTIEPQKWIPISVKLPEKRQDVIVTVNDGAIYTDTDEWIGTGFFAYGHNVVAWQSLPDPWKEEEE